MGFFLLNWFILYFQNSKGISRNHTGTATELQVIQAFTRRSPFKALVWKTMVAVFVSYCE